MKDTNLLQKIVSHPSNKDLIAYISREFEEAAMLETDWEEMRRKSWSIGTLPEAVDLLWIRFAAKVPETCRAIFMNRPVLINPDNGEIFGFATGTRFPMVKLKGDQLIQIRIKIGDKELTQLNETFGNSQEVGADWVYCSSSLTGVADFFADAYLLTRQSY